MSAPLRIAALLSGRGRSVLNLEEAIRLGTLNAELAVVVAHDPSLPGVERCRNKGLDVRVVPGSATESCSDELDVLLRTSEAELICLCGYLRRFRVGELWKGKVVNIHPALLPDFGGQGMFGNRVHQAVLESGRKESGCTVHWVDEAYDQGEIILQHHCEVNATDDIESLAEKVFEAECIAYPRAIELVASKIRTPSSLCES